MSDQITNQEPANKPALANKQLLQEKVLGDFTQYEINTLKSTIANGLNNSEFALFINTCASAGLNPFLKQITPIVYDSDKNGRRFDIQVPVEGIEHLARKKEGWAGYDLQLVCENDTFKAKRDKESGNWIIEEHEFAFPRGRTMGAYCIVPRKGFKDVVIFMEVSEVAHLTEDYRTKMMWGKWFNDMFKKHVKKRGLREQFGIEIDDMSDLSSGPDQYENDIPSYKPQERKDIVTNEEEETEFDEGAAVSDLWAEIEDYMISGGISEEQGREISMQRFNGCPPEELDPQQLAAFKRFIELEIDRNNKHQEAQAAEIKQEKESVIEEEPKEKETPQEPAKKDLNEAKSLDDAIDFFGQQELEF
jgi:recombination protein RecT